MNSINLLINIFNITLLSKRLDNKWLSYIKLQFVKKGTYIKANYNQIID